MITLKITHPKPRSTPTPPTTCPAGAQTYTQLHTLPNMSHLVTTEVSFSAFSALKSTCSESLWLSCESQMNSEAGGAAEEEGTTR